MKSWINYHHLYYFKTIVDEGTVSKAASKLSLGQPTLSAQLKQFEESLGVPLFERRKNRLVLTEQGKIAFDYAKNIFRMGSEMYEVLKDGIKPQKLSLHVGALDTIPKQIVLQIVEQAMRISPCQITLSEGKSGELLRELGSHQMDLLITNFLPSGMDAKGLYPKSISKQAVAIYGSPKFKRLKKNFPQSINNEPMIFPTYDSRLRPDLDHWAKLSKINCDIVIESQDISVKKLLAINGIGLIPAARHTVRNQVLRGELIELGQVKGVSEELFLLSAQRKIENPIVARIKQEFRLSF